MSAAARRGRRAHRRRPRDPEQEDEHPVSVLELFFDLVFVLAITQVTLLLAERPDARRARCAGLLILALLWWSWVGYSWLTNSIDVEDVATRVSFFVAMAAFTVVALAVPRGLRRRRALVRARLRGRARRCRSASTRTAPTTTTPTTARSCGSAPGFLSERRPRSSRGAVVGGDAQPWIWLAAIVIDVLTPARLRRPRVPRPRRPLRRAPRPDRHHRARRVDRRARRRASPRRRSTSPLVVGASLGVAAAATLWWLYFDIVAIVAEHRMKQARGGRARADRARLLQLHPLLHDRRHRPARARPEEGRCSTPSEPLKLVPADRALRRARRSTSSGHIAFRLRNVGTLNRQRLVVGDRPRRADPASSTRSTRSPRWRIVDRRPRRARDLRVRALRRAPRRSCSSGSGRAAERASAAR